jgi:hypothetical protein
MGIVSIWCYCVGIKGVLYERMELSTFRAYRKVSSSTVCQSFYTRCNVIAGSLGRHYDGTFHLRPGKAIRRYGFLPLTLSTTLFSLTSQ